MSQQFQVELSRNKSAQAEAVFNSYHSSKLMEFLSFYLHCHKNKLLLYQLKQTLSHGVRNFYFNLSRSLRLAFIFFKICTIIKENIVTYTCDRNPFLTNLISIMHSKQLSISFLCRLMLQFSLSLLLFCFSSPFHLSK